MKIPKEKRGTHALTPVESDFLKRSWQESWTHIRTVVDVVHEPILILDKDLRVIAANDPFYHTFRVEPKETEGRVVYELGNGQWNIRALRKLLEDILPKHTFFKGFEVTHDFPSIGYKAMILNGRRIYVEKKVTAKASPAIILLAMEDVTEMMTVAKDLADRTNQFEGELTERTARLESDVRKLKKEMDGLKNKSD